MEVTVHESGPSKVAVIKSPHVLIDSVQDALDLMATVRYVYGCDKIVVDLHNITDGFFDLKTRLAGDILQKFTNYQVRVAITGDFSRFPVKSLKSFIYESNKGNQVFFLPDAAAAIEKLHSV